MIVSAHWLDADFTSHAKCLSVTKLPSSSQSTPAADAGAGAVVKAVIDEWSLDRQNLQIIVSAPDVYYQDISQVLSYSSTSCS